MTGPFIGKGTTLGTGVTSTTTPIAGIVDVSQPNGEFAKVDGTQYTDAFEKFIPGWLNVGEVNFKLHYTETVMATLDTLMGVLNQFWEITFIDGSGYTFQGWLKKLSGNAPIKGVVQNDATIVITTKPVRKAAVS